MEEILKDKEERKKQFEKLKGERSPARRVEEKDEPLDEKPLFKAPGAYTMGQKQKTSGDLAASKNNQLGRSDQDAKEVTAPNSWHEIVAANDTNKHIIHKFMKKGFSSLSAEELACTMVQPDFTLDFKKNTKEDWVAGYQFKVVARLSKCNFNLKWKTRSSITTQG